MKKIVTLFVALFSFAAVFAAPTITNVVVTPHAPSDGKVDIEVALEGTADEITKVDLVFTALDVSSGEDISVSSIIKDGEAIGSETYWTRKFIWDARKDVCEVKIEDVQLSVIGEISVGGVQLWENGPYWATCNVGARKPEEYGYYFMWGDTKGYQRVNDKWSAVDGSNNNASLSIDNCITYNKSSSVLQAQGYVDTYGRLLPSHDAATSNLGSPWYMPSYWDFVALKNNCKASLVSVNGVLCRKIKGIGDFESHCIYLPCAGFGFYTSTQGIGHDCQYWSSTLKTDASGRAYCLDVYDDTIQPALLPERYNCMPIRAIRSANSSSITINGPVVHFMLDMSSGASNAELNLWLKAKYPELADDAACEAKAKETAANGHKVWECYVAGEDPTDSASKFAAEITVGEDGKPVVSWNPDLGSERVYKILGSTDLKTWVEVPEGHEANYNFFKVTVEMK